MTSVYMLIILMIWGVGTAYRAYRQARFYQIEEYMSMRYLRWYARSVERLFPKRTIIAWFLSSLLAFMMSEAPGTLFPALILIVGSIIANLPPKEGEIKKAFKATPRAKRLLIATFVLIILGFLIDIWVFNQINPSREEFWLLLASGAGLIEFLLAPIYLVGGNLVAKPYEAWQRRRFIEQARKVLETVRPNVIGITGSYGKTSTKTFLAHFLKDRYKTYPTPKSYNTLMGLCLAINNDLADDLSIEYFIAEMGAYVPGEIERICDLVHPTTGIIVEVGPQHLERFGTIENVATAKYELIKALPEDGVGIFNWDNPHVRAMFEKGYPHECIAVSQQINFDEFTNSLPHLIASEVEETLNGLRFTVTDRRTNQYETFDVPLNGQHNVTNILLATAAALHEGLTLKDIARRARTLTPAESRLVKQSTASGITIINDAYSANPAGAISALKVLNLYQNGKRVLVTPGMVELGDLMDVENHKLGIEAAKYATDIILVGKEQTRPIQAGLAEAQFSSGHLQVVDTLAEAIQWYERNLKAGDTVLFLNDLPDTYSAKSS